MSIMHCHIKLGEVPLHLYPILAGFRLLEKQKVISVDWMKIKKNEPCLPYNMLEVVVNQSVRLLYDVNDGYDNLLASNQKFDTFYNELLTSFDYCFKRSFDEKRNRKLKQGENVLPLGLNYMATVKGNVAHYPMPHDPLKEKVKKLIRLLPMSSHYNGHYHYETFEAQPFQDVNPKILFMARLWDVDGDFEGQLSEEKKEERAYINEFRATCIRLCREAFGPQFFGGVTPSAFADSYYSDLVVEKKVTERHHYLNKMKESSICIATMGLHQSIGWKFAEYIAASRAIVTEDSAYQLPGNIREGQNYLVFKTPEACVEQINDLMRNDQKRYQMMKANHDYYQNFVRPDVLVWNSLKALEPSIQKGVNEA